jgi:hypothetical protein
MAQVWVANYGLANVVVVKVKIETPDKAITTRYKNTIVPSGSRKYFRIANRHWQGLELTQNVQVTLSCESMSETLKDRTAWTLFLTERHAIYKVRRGLYGLWPIVCPKCKRQIGIWIRVQDLKSFDEASKRRHQLEHDVADSCPQHASEFMLTIEDVARQRQSEARE